MFVLKHPMVIGHEFVGDQQQSASRQRFLGKWARRGCGETRPAPAISARCAFRPSKICAAPCALWGSAQFNPHVNGGFSEYVVVKPEHSNSYDRRVPANVMAFSNRLAVAIHAVKKAGQLTGKRVLVIGAGWLSGSSRRHAVPEHLNWWHPILSPRRSNWRMPDGDHSGDGSAR